jgi:hypothetical protein
MRAFIISIAAALLAASPAVDSVQAADRCGGARNCGSCGKSDCQVVCEMKTVKKSCWVVECEQFCPTLPNCPKWSFCGLSFCGSKKARGSCDKTAACGDCGKGCNARPMVPPKCAKSRTIKKLVKKEYTCEVPVYKCTACAGCGPVGCGGEVEEAPAAAPAEARTPTVAPLPRMTGMQHSWGPAER